MKKFLQLHNKSLSDFGVATFKDLWAKAQAEGYDGLQVKCNLVLEKKADHKFHGVFSTEDEDRHGDIVFQNWDLKNFKKNPVLIDSHNYGSIEFIVGRIEPISVKDNKLQGDIEFAHMNPRGMLLSQLADGGFWNTTSVGFIPKEFDDDGNILKSELLEISAVSVPANPHALLEKSNVKNDGPNNDDDSQNPAADGQAPAGDSNDGKDPGQEGEPQGGTDAGGAEGGAADEPTAEPDAGEPAKNNRKTIEQLTADAVNSLLVEAEKQKNRRLFLLTSIAQAIRALGENSKVETPTRDRANEKRIINRAIRELIREKNN